jgi:hypothetical protein
VKVNGVAAKRPEPRGDRQVLLESVCMTGLLCFVLLGAVVQE